MRSSNTFADHPGFGGILQSLQRLERVSARTAFAKTQAEGCVSTL
jgi:hypothetical protein